MLEVDGEGVLGLRCVWFHPDGARPVVPPGEGPRSDPQRGPLPGVVLWDVTRDGGRRLSAPHQGVPVLHGWDVAVPQRVDVHDQLRGAAYRQPRPVR